MYPGEHVDLLVLLIEEVLEISHLGLQRAHPILERLCVSSGEGATAEFVAGLALETDVGTLGAARSNAVATDLLASTAIAGLGDTALGAVAHLDDFHR